MIFFVANDGTVMESVPSPVYQGAANANDVYLVAPFASNLQTTVAFKLPNGVLTEQYAMKLFGELEGVINKQTGKPYSGWQFSMPNEITRYYGVVTAQFFFYSAESAVVIATSSVNFTVGRGVPEILPNTPTADIYEIILSNLSALQQQLDNGFFAARSIYAWNSTYTYGAGELVFYPQKGEYGVFLKSLTDNNKAEPYVNGALDTANWLLVSDFNILTELYSLKGDVETAVQETRDNVAAAEKIIVDGETEIAGIIAQGKNDIDGIVAAGQADIDATAAHAEQLATDAATAAQNASASEAQAKSYADGAADKAKEAQNWAELAQHYAQFGIKLNTDYQSVEELPAEGNPQYIYLIPNGSTGNNSYDEYMWIADKGAYEKIGTTEVDLTSYATKAEVAETYATKEMLSKETESRQTQDQRLNNRIYANENNLYAEITARESADQELGERITAEETARENADTALGNRIDDNEANITALQSGKVNKSGDTMTGAIAAPAFKQSDGTKDWIDFLTGKGNNFGIGGKHSCMYNLEEMYSPNNPPPIASSYSFGYIRLTNGFQICWGVDANVANNTDSNVNFPLPFGEIPALILSKSKQDGWSSSWYSAQYPLYAMQVDRTHFRVRNTDFYNGMIRFYIAIGRYY